MDAGNSMKTPVLSEYQEGKIFVAWLRKKGLLFSHLPLNTWTGSYKQLAKNKASGVCKGVPDYVIVLKDKILFVELKKSKGGKISKEQRAWLLALSNAGAHTSVCRGAKEAIQFVEQFLEGSKDGI